MVQLGGKIENEKNWTCQAEKEGASEHKIDGLSFKKEWPFLFSFLFVFYLFSSFLISSPHLASPLLSFPPFFPLSLPFLPSYLPSISISILYLHLYHYLFHFYLLFVFETSKKKKRQAETDEFIKLDTGGLMVFPAESSNFPEIWRKVLA